MGGKGQGHQNEKKENVGSIAKNGLGQGRKKIERS